MTDTLTKIVDALAEIEESRGCKIRTIYLGPAEYQSAIIESMELMVVCDSELFTIYDLFGRRLHPISENGMFFSDKAE